MVKITHLEKRNGQESGRTPQLVSGRWPAGAVKSVLQDGNTWLADTLVAVSGRCFGTAVCQRLSRNAACEGQTKPETWSTNQRHIGHETTALLQLVSAGELQR